MADAVKPSIYFDHHATMPPTAAHLHELMALLPEAGGNPSRGHAWGRAARRALEMARDQVAGLLDCSRHQVVFVSGATEGNHTVVHAVSERLAGRSANFVITAGEHPCHIKPCEQLAAQGCFELRVVPLNRDGIVERAALVEMMDEHTAYVGINHLNHETGLVNPLMELAVAAKERAPCHVHVDAAQSYGKWPLGGLLDGPVDSLTASGHKIGALKGVGCVYVKDPSQLTPMLLGGGQERGLRAGTENLAGILSFGLRSREIAATPHWLDHTRQLYDMLLQKLQSYAAVKTWGTPALSARTALAFVLPGRSADQLELVWERHGMSLGRGAACSSREPQGSAVLRAMGATVWEAKNAFRLSLGPQNTRSHIDMFIQALATELERGSPAGG